MYGVLKAVTLVLWALSLYLWIAMGAWYLFAFLFALHFLEIFAKGLSVGKKAGYSALYSAIMTQIFGFIWWKPINDRLNS